MSTSTQDEQILRKRTLDNDRKVREQQGTTMQAFAQADAEIPGRFAVVANAQVVGQTPIPNYPAASSPWQGPDLVGPEPPLSAYDNPTFEPLELPVSQGNSGDAGSSGTPLADERAASSLSSDGPAPEVLPASASANAGPSPVCNLRRF